MADDGTCDCGGSVAPLLTDSENRVCSVVPTKTNGINTIRIGLRPAASWRLDDVRFAFDSSFVLPSASREFGMLAEVRPPEDGDGPATGLLMSVFGHGDPTNSDEYNKALSGRRAMAIYALLIRDAAIWEHLYSNKYHGDDWGTRSLQTMLRTIGYDASDNGYLDERTTAAVKAFQTDRDFTHKSGFAGPDTRKALFLAYMDALSPVRYRRQDFMSRGSGVDGKCDYQGCSEFNPVLVFSKAEAAEYAKPANKAQRDADNVSNRRVVVYMFSPKLALPAASWPCPTVKEGDAGIPKCKARFWPDGNARRNPTDNRREHLKNGLTMACAFYDSMARRACTEGVRKTVMLTLLNPDGKWATRAPYRLTAGSDVRTGYTDDLGKLTEQNVTDSQTGLVEWGAPRGATLAAGAQPSIYALRARFFFSVSELDTDAGRVDRELFNLGYRDGDQSRNRRRFSDEYFMPESDDATVHVVHGSGIQKAQRT